MGFPMIMKAEFSDWCAFFKLAGSKAVSLGEQRDVLQSLWSDRLTQEAVVQTFCLNCLLVQTHICANQTLENLFR